LPEADIGKLACQGDPQVTQLQTKRMMEFAFPKRLGRLSYFIRAIPANAVMLWAVAAAETELFGDALLLCIAGLVVGVYAVFFVYLPRVRDAGITAWSLLLALIPYGSIAYGLVLLFRPSKLPMQTVRVEEPPRPPSIAGSECSACGKRLVLSSEGVIDEANKVVCNECHAGAT
jgi:uncharacterized membrane protein YhaH (DUF805 family)